MSKSYYLSKTDHGKLSLLERLMLRLPLYAEALRIDAAELESQKADAAVLRYALMLAEQAQNSAHECTAYKNLMRDGGNGSGVSPPTVLTSEPPPPAVEPGIIPRTTARIARIKAEPGYTEAMGHDLGIIGSESPIDVSTWQPQLDIQFNAGHPMLVWTKGDAEALEVWVARGTPGDFVLLNSTTVPHYTDPTPLPAVLTTWTYKAIYHLHDAQVGRWSNAVSVVVGG